MRHSLTKMADIQVTHASVCATVDWLSARHVNPFEQQRGCRGWLVTWNGGHFPRSSNHRGLRHLCQAADPVDQVVSVGRKYGGEATLRLWKSQKRLQNWGLCTEDGKYEKDAVMHVKQCVQILTERYFLARLFSFVFTLSLELHLWSPVASYSSVWSETLYCSHVRMRICVFDIVSRQFPPAGLVYIEPSAQLAFLFAPWFFF